MLRVGLMYLESEKKHPPFEAKTAGRRPGRKIIVRAPGKDRPPAGKSRLKDVFQPGTESAQKNQKKNCFFLDIIRRACYILLSRTPDELRTRRFEAETWRFMNK
jgi:hypothetical protein